MPINFTAFKNFGDKLYNLLRRRTSSTNFIPAIDGLRFLAIWVVVADHLHGFIRTKIPFAYTRPAAQYGFIYQFFDGNGRKGVLLFFMISGFILGMPFAKQFLQNEKKVRLKSYFLRRLTRLEPPYIFNMLICYVLLVMYKGHEFAAMFSRTFSGLWPSLATSLVYMHNILMPNNMSINPVSWSLEIEVQFYLLVPLLVLVFKLPQFYRRLVLILSIVFFTIISQVYRLPILTIYSFLQYFLLGFLLLDIYLSGFKLKFNTAGNLLAGLAVFWPFFYVDSYQTKHIEYYMVLMVFAIGLLVMTNNFWTKIFSFRFFTAIGGMCYSIYLWHDLIISAVSNVAVHINFSHSYPVVLLWQMGIALPAVVAVSSVFYLLIEKPCMDREWPAKLWARVLAIFRKKDSSNTALPVKL